ncbi:MAG: hypothetical protein H7Z14_17720 [Anaerolineae bacterium]|nr:hypothetical protein [Phycisphaerae bacterium]
MLSDNRESEGSSPRRRGALGAIVVCAALVFGFALLSYSAVSTKSATFDEPYHFAAAYTHVFANDYRLDPEDPPLWSWLAMLPISRDALQTAPLELRWQQVIRDRDAAPGWVEDVMYHVPGNDAAELINRSRMAMTTLGALIVALACAIAWKLAGPVAAIAAGVLLALDPLLLGHAPLVKNDVAISLITLLLAGALIATMSRATIWRLLAVAVCIGLALSTKFSGLMLFPLAMASLGVRAIGTRPWRFLSRDLVTRRSKLGAVGVFAIAAAPIAWAIIWASYGFRYSPTPQRDVVLDEAYFVNQVRMRTLVGELGRDPTSAEIAGWRPNLSTRAVLWMNRNHLLPNAYSMGFLFTYGATQSRTGFLLGELRNTGWWYYFPLAMLFKTPMASIVAVVGTIMVATIVKIRRRIALPDRVRDFTICLLVLGGGYLVLAMSSRLNIGVRHMLPIYPLLYIATAIAFAMLLAHRRRVMNVVGSVLAIVLAFQTFSAWPDFIAFFNAPSGSARGGLRMLGDSNLDWGQDLPLLADWQRRHPGVRLYLAYFGVADPDSYGLEFVNVGGAAASRRPLGALSGPGVFAVSATRLQGIYLPPELREKYATLRDIRPREVLGGTIYLYDHPFEKSSRD